MKSRIDKNLYAEIFHGMLRDELLTILEQEVYGGNRHWNAEVGRFDEGLQATTNKANK